jgi:hypothetical protein
MGRLVPIVAVPYVRRFWRQRGKMLRIIDECIDVPAKSMVGVEHQGRAAAKDPFGHRLTLSLQVRKPIERSAK